MEIFLLIQFQQNQLKLLRDQQELLLEGYNFVKSENEALKQKIARLEEQLGLNSSNSSLPPSRDFSRQLNKSRRKSDRKAGGQPGHKKQTYEFKIADEVIDVYPETCACGHGVEGFDSYQAHQKIEIPPIKPYVKEYRLHQGACSACGKQVRASLPEGVEPDLLGPHAKAIVGCLGGFYHLSKRHIQQVLQDVFNLPLSLGLISQTEARVSQKMKSYYEELVNQIEESPYLYLDETGHKCQGKRGWAWIMTTHTSSVLKLTASRGKKVLEALLPDYEGDVVTDLYGVYTYFDPDKRQVCWAHLKRDFQRFAHSRDPCLSELGHRLGLVTARVFALYRAYRAQSIDSFFFKRRIRKAKEKMLHTLKAVRRVPQDHQAHRVAQNIIKAFDMMWRFVDKPCLEPTNNLAERQIRKYVIYRKTSFFTWSQRGNEFIERIMSLYLAERGNNNTPFQTLHNLILQK